MSNINPILLADCLTEEDRANRTHNLLNAEESLRRTLKLMKDYRDAARPSKLDYTVPSWSCMMADWLGYDRAVTTLEKLLSLLDQKV